MRKKITLHLPSEIVGEVDLACKRYLGIGRNAFFVVGSILLLAKLTPFLNKTKRSVLLALLDSEWKTIVEDARKTA